MSAFLITASAFNSSGLNTPLHSPEIDSVHQWAMSTGMKDSRGQVSPWTFHEKRLSTPAIPPQEAFPPRAQESSIQDDPGKCQAGSLIRKVFVNKDRLFGISSSILSFFFQDEHLCCIYFLNFCLNLTYTNNTSVDLAHPSPTCNRSMLILFCLYLPHIPHAIGEKPQTCHHISNTYIFVMFYIPNIYLYHFLNIQIT